MSDAELYAALAELMKRFFEKHGDKAVLMIEKGRVTVVDDSYEVAIHRDAYENEEVVVFSTVQEALEE